MTIVALVLAVLAVLFMVYKVFDLKDQVESQTSNGIHYRDRWDSAIKDLREAHQENSTLQTNIREAEKYLKSAGFELDGKTPNGSPIVYLHPLRELIVRMDNERVLYKSRDNSFIIECEQLKARIDNLQARIDKLLEMNENQAHKIARLTKKRKK